MKNDEHFIQKFQPELNEDGAVKIYYPDNSEHVSVVRSSDPEKIWTMISEDEQKTIFLVPGYRRVNRLCHVIASIPLDKDEKESGDWDQVLWYSESSS